MLARQILPRAEKHVAEDQSNAHSIHTTYVSDYPEEGLAPRLHASEASCGTVDPARSFLFDLEVPSSVTKTNSLFGEPPESLPTPISDKLEELFELEETSKWKEPLPALESLSNNAFDRASKEQQLRSGTLDQEQTLELPTVRVARTLGNKHAKSRNVTTPQPSKRRLNLLALMVLCALSLIAEIALASENSIAPASNAQASAKKNRIAAAISLTALPVVSDEVSESIRPQFSEAQALVSTVAIRSLEDLKAYAATAKQNESEELVFQPIVEPVMPVVPQEMMELHPYDPSKMVEPQPRENDYLLNTLPAEETHVVEVWTGSARATNLTPKF